MAYVRIRSIFADKVKSLKLLSPRWLIGLKDIRFWLCFFFLIRLLGITNPPLEKSHDWRQCLTNMISRNLYETDPNPFYPRVDNGGRHEGIIASEFPVFNYAVFLVSLPFGYDHWYGRLINLLFSTLACWYFYKLLKMYFTEPIAFNATLLLTVSIWFAFSRKSMPDVFSMSLMLIALYHAFRFLETSRGFHLAFYGILAMLGMLAKLPALYSLSILALPVFSPSGKLLPKASLTVVTLAAVSIAYWWYFVWGDYLLKTWEYQLFFPKNYKEGPREFMQYPGKTLEQFYFSAFQSFLAFGVFVWGIFLCFRKRFWLPLQILGVTFPVFLLFMIISGNVFALHSYYIIPFVPVMAIPAAFGLTSLPSRLYPWILACLIIESLANQQHDFFIPDSEKFKLGLEKDIDAFLPPKEKIALAGTTGPQYLYFAHRRGWGLSPEQTLDTAYMHGVMAKGYQYLVVIKREVQQFPNYPMIGENNHFRVYELRSPEKSNYSRTKAYR